MEIGAHPCRALNSELAMVECCHSPIIRGCACCTTSRSPAIFNHVAESYTALVLVRSGLVVTVVGRIIPTIHSFHYKYRTSPSRFHWLLLNLCRTIACMDEVTVKGKWSRPRSCWPGMASAVTLPQNVASNANTPIIEVSLTTLASTPHLGSH